MTDKRELIESLSPRQREILVLVTQHYSSKEIAYLLSLSAATVDSHIAAALQRMGVRSRREAAALLIEMGYPSGRPDPDPKRSPPGSHHGGDYYTNRRLLSGTGDESISPSERGRLGLSQGNANEPSASPIKSGMARVIARYLLDGVYIIVFFAVMSAVAFGAHWIVIKCEQWQIDPTVLLVLKAVSYTLVVIDAVGVLTATGLLTYRFIRATMRADD